MEKTTRRSVAKLKKLGRAICTNFGLAIKRVSCKKHASLDGPSSNL
uniref:Uncharacterized protein n=1 Tax=Setaria italica TaxID=4555 RepID=K4APG6_SETIT